MSSPLSRRAWLRTTSVGVGGALLMPSVLPALGRRTAPIDQELESYARAVAAERAAAGPVRLQSNENPFGMSPRAKQALMDAWDEHNKYGSPAIALLRQTYATHVGVPAEYVMVTQGSNEVICTAALAFGIDGKELVAADPTFETLSTYGTHMGRTVHKVPLNPAHGHDLNAMDQRITANTGLVFVCNPNNPTGALMPDAPLRDFVKSASKRTTVLVDEAYHEYVTDPSYRSMIDLVVQGENVIVLRTASKIHGLAGCRIGFAIAHPDVIARLEGFKTGAPNALSARAAIAAVNDVDWPRYCVQQNTEAREILRAAIAASGRVQTPSQTNFIFFDAQRPTNTVRKACEERGFLVGRAFPPYDTWVRVSVGTPDEMRAFARVLPEVLA